MDPCIEKLPLDLKTFSIYIVDGELIRKEIDPDFNNFGQHYEFPFIPKNEFWIDREETPSEIPFFIAHLIAEYRQMKQGKSVNEALEYADRIEQQERNKAGAHKHKKSTQTDLDMLKKRALYQAKDIEVWLVDGEYVRSNLFIDFTEGGHDQVYDFIPENEIWIDDDVLPNEREFVFGHEYFERKLMLGGLSYSKAHERALVFEFKLRHKSD